MNKICTHCSVAFEITDEDMAFYDKVSPVYNGKKEQISPPMQCPQCRQQRRFAFRNQMYLYTRPSSVTGKQIFSMYTPDAPIKVTENEIWYGDGWDAMEEGREFDFSRPFFEQFNELFRSVPLPARALIPEIVNSDYSNNATALKNCYLVFNASYVEDSMYCESIHYSKDCIDCTRTSEGELCYDCIACSGYDLQSSFGSINCSNSRFLHNCLSCKHCFACVNLCRREYCIFNEQKTKQEYEAFIQSIDLQSYSQREAIREKFMALAISLPQPELETNLSEDVSGNYIRNAKSAHESFFIRNAENVKYCCLLDDKIKDCMDVTLWGDGLELSYEAALVGKGATNLVFSYYMFAGNSYLAYCVAMTNCSDCFGCAGLKYKKYCIFNKQYTKEEYDMLVPRIIEHMRRTGEWGEFFPLGMSPIPYNQSLAGRYYPLERREVERMGMRWYEPEQEAGEGVPAAQLPDRLPETDDPVIAKSALSGRSFRITSQEIKRYREFNVPLPRITYDERMEERSRSMGMLKLYDRACARTGKPIRTTYPPDSPWIVWEKDEWYKEFHS